jgi:hypothetical protein
VVKIGQKLVHVVCERPLMRISIGVKNGIRIREEF